MIKYLVIVSGYDDGSLIQKRNHRKLLVERWELLILIMSYRESLMLADDNNIALSSRHIYATSCQEFIRDYNPWILAIYIQMTAQLWPNQSMPLVIKSKNDMHGYLSIIWSFFGLTGYFAQIKSIWYFRQHTTIERSE